MKKEERQAALKKELVGRLIKNLAKTEPTIISQISPEAKGMSYPESYRAKPFCIECGFYIDLIAAHDKQFFLKHHSYFLREDVERERRSADALLLAAQDDLRHERAEHEKEQTAIIGSLKELDGKIRELDEVMHDMSDVSDAWQDRAEAAAAIEEKKRGEWAQKINGIVKEINKRNDYDSWKKALDNSAYFTMALPKELKALAGEIRGDTNE